MALTTVGSIALDSVETPFGERKEMLGGSATYFSCAASYFSRVHIVGVVGADFPKQHIALLEERGVDVSGLEVQPGKTFRWSGRYGFDLNQRETLETQLNVFEKFHPVLPEAASEAEYLFLANIDPDLQLEVLNRMKRLKFCACDTMNLWIDTKRDKVVELISRVNAIVLNDAEARQLTCEPNLVRAAKSVQAMGCPVVVIKKGEHGCLLFTAKSHFSAPAYPLESVFDPTGAGDSFAGGFMGYLAKTGDLSFPSLKKAIIHGSVVASFCVEQFGLDRLKTLTEFDIRQRYSQFVDLAQFE